jgi:hypothetical protein
MANKYLAIRDGGKTSEEGFARLVNKIAGATNSGIIGSGDFLVTQDGTPGMLVDIATGDIVIPYQNYLYHCWSTATQTQTIASNSSGNPRIDCVVAYVDLAVVSSASNNNPDAIKFYDVTGTPAGSPVAPNGTAIQAAVGAGNPYIILANVAVANSATSILNANITDLRPVFKLSGSIINPVVSGEYNNGNSGASPAIDWSKGNHQYITLNNNAVTFTYSNAKAGQTLTLRLLQDSSGGRVPTLPTGTKYTGHGAAPSFSTGINYVDIIVVYYDGASYYTQAALDFA